MSLFKICIAIVASVVIINGMTVEDLKILIDSKYASLVGKSPWMGISVGVITPDFGENFFSYGRQNISGPTVDENTIFAINSMTKVFTGICLAYVSQQYGVKLDAKMQPYALEHFLPIDGGEEITFLDIATHWSGLGARPSNLNDDLPDPYEGYTDELFFEDLSNYSFSDLHIGQQYYYSNYGFGLLGYVLSIDIMKGNFKGMMTNVIFDSLKMTSSALTNDDKVENFANGHDVDGSLRSWGNSCEAVLGSWAVRSSATDMVKFLEANIYPQQVDAKLAPALVLAQKPQRYTDEEGFKIGLGWRVQEDGTHLKSGSGDGFESIMFFNAKMKIGLVVLSNSYIETPDDVTTTGSDIFAELMRAYVP